MRGLRKPDGLLFAVNGLASCLTAACIEKCNEYESPCPSQRLRDAFLPTFHLPRPLSPRDSAAHTFRKHR